MSNGAEPRPGQISPAQLMAARLLLRSSRHATLATVHDDQPHAALVTPACVADGSVLLLLSDLSRHTRDPRLNRRCALLCMGRATPVTNPQQWARLSLACTAELDAAPALRSRFLALHPEAALYAAFQDFHIWRLHPHEVQFIAGFGQAWTVPAEAFLPRDAAGTCPEEIMALCNKTQAPSLAQIGYGQTGVAGDWRLVGLDPDGCDLAGPGGIVHVGWPDGMGARPQDALRRLAEAAQAVNG